MPVQIMLKPLRKRFKYHFCGNKQTNSLEKVSKKNNFLMNFIIEIQFDIEARVVFNSNSKLDKGPSGFYEGNDSTHI